MSTQNTPQTTLANALAAASRTPSQKAADSIDRQIDLLNQQLSAAAKVIASHLDATPAPGGKAKLTREQVLTEFGQRRACVESFLAQIAVPAAPAPATASATPANAQKAS